MDRKQILGLVLIISLILLASYLFTLKGATNGKVRPVTPVTPAMQETIKEKTTDIKVTFIELGSVGCIPCDMMRPILDEIEKEYKGRVLVRFYDIRTPDGRPFAEKYGLRVIPTQVFLDKDGNEYYRHAGFFSKDEIIKILQLRGGK